ncbi:MAG: hypothetical protein ACRCX8_08685 [Sarcina sp.]
MKCKDCKELVKRDGILGEMKNHLWCNKLNRGICIQFQEDIKELDCDKVKIIKNK